MTPESTIPQQERVAATLASFLFFLPILMKKKTEFTAFYMKQSFLLFVVNVSFMVVGSLFWPLHGIANLVGFIIFIIAAFLAWNAWNGEKLSVPGLLENSEKIIATLGITDWFTPGK